MAVERVPVLSQSSLARLLFRAQQASLWPLVPPAATTLVVLLGLSAGAALTVAAAVIPVAFLLFATIVPWRVANRRAAALVALERTSGPTAALVALLEQPAQIERLSTVVYAAAIVFVVAVTAALYGLPVSAVVLVLVMLVPVALLAALRYRMAVEAALTPDLLALARVASDDWVLEPRFRWSLARRLPWLALLSSTTVVAGGTSAILPYLVIGGTLRLSDLAVPVLTAGWFGLVGALTFWRLGKRYAAASAALSEAGEALLQGRGAVTTWVAADETGVLARSLGRSLSVARRRSARLEGSARRLASAAEELAGFSDRQQQLLAEQAATLGQTRQAAAEVRQGSTVVAARSRALLDGVRTAEALAARGEERLGAALDALDRVREDVGGIDVQISGAGTRASRITTIAVEVKEIATRSNVLALNAAIEATRAGSAARGFGVVATEMRRLADESLTATNTAAGALAQVQDAIARASAVSRAGGERIHQGLETVRLSGEALGELAGLVRAQSSALGEIAAAVSQQAGGVDQLFGAIHQLSTAMDAAVRELAVTRDAVEHVRRVAAELTADDDTAA